MRCQPGYLAQARFKPRAIIWDLFEDNPSRSAWPAQKKIETAVELDGFASRVLYLGLWRVHL